MNTGADPSQAGLPDGVREKIRAMLSNRAAPCPESELLDRYSRRELAGRALERIEEHLAVCPACVRAVSALTRPEGTGPEGAGEQTGWEAVESRLDREFYERLKAAPPPASRPANGGSRRLSRPKTAWLGVLDAWIRPRPLAAAFSLAALVLAGSYTAAYLSRGPNFDIARVKPEPLPRMRAVPEAGGFEEGMRRYERGDYTGAIALLSASRESGPLHYAAYYYLGLSHLGRAESGLPGLPFRFDSRDVGKGIEALEAALVLAGDNAHFKADCHWHIGKALLMRGDTEKAAGRFEAILEMADIDTSRKDAARDMLNRIR
ncbi:MAG: tetratricopeptide repeat protein [bacterium]|nr:tetratricopeptide repeat protein [bacterium]